MQARQCELCHKALATVRCVKSNGTLKWYYCEPCYKNIMGEEPTGEIVRSREGFPPEPPQPYRGIIIPFQDGAESPMSYKRKWIEKVREAGTRYADNVMGTQRTI